MSGNLIDSFYGVLEDYYTKVSDFSNHPWPKSFIRAAFDAYKIANSLSRERFLAMLANTMATLDLGVREGMIKELGIDQTVSGVIFDPPPWPERLPEISYAEVTPDDLEDHRARSMAMVSDDAERVAMTVMRPGFRYALTIMQKQMEMQRYYASGKDSSGSYPHMEAEIPSLHATLDDVAEETLSKTRIWTHINSSIERARIEGIVAIENAKDFDEINAARSKAKAEMVAVVQQVMQAQAQG